MIINKITPITPLKKVNKSSQISDKKSFTDDLLHAVAKKKYDELENIKANLRILKKSCECKRNILMLDNWIINCEIEQGIKH